MTNKTLRGYQLAISEATGCTDGEKLEKIESYMRNIYFHSTLDWVDSRTLAKSARESMAELEMLNWKFI